MSLTLYRGNTMVLEFTGAKNELTGDVITAAEVKATLRGPGGPLPGDWPVTLAPVDGSAGSYRALFPPGLQLVGPRVQAELTVEHDGVFGSWRGEIQVQDRPLKP